jgi:allantoicase
VTHLTDLASRWLGGSVVAASDESFGEKENLLNPSPAVFEPGHYGNRGEIVDGWETRRRREPGHDWAIIRLGAPGIITSADIDTSFFTGNFPQSASIEACGWEGYPNPGELASAASEWEQIVPVSNLAGDSHNTFTVTDARRFTHVRLSVYPDGGVARLRVPGRVVPDPRELDGLTVDLIGQNYGGTVVESSDDFYTSASHLTRPDQARTMGEGWETQRRRGPGNDYVIFRLAFPGVVRRVVIDTAHFKYNASAAVAVYGCAQDPYPPPGSPGWLPLLGRTRLQPDTRHVLPAEYAGPVSTVRLDAFPDGGLSRVRLLGSFSADGRRDAGYLWFNSLPPRQAIQCLADAGIQAELAGEISRRRPLAQGRLVELHSGSRDGRAAAHRVLTGLLEGSTRA